MVNRIPFVVEGHAKLQEATRLQTGLKMERPQLAQHFSKCLILRKNIDVSVLACRTLYFILLSARIADNLFIKIIQGFKFLLSKRRAIALQAVEAHIFLGIHTELPLYLLAVAMFNNYIFSITVPYSFISKFSFHLFHSVAPFSLFVPCAYVFCITSIPGKST